MKPEVCHQALGWQFRLKLPNKLGGKRGCQSHGMVKKIQWRGVLKRGGRARAKYEIQRSRKEEGEGREVGFAS